MKFIDKRGRA